MLMTLTAYGRKDWMTLMLDLHCRVIGEFTTGRRDGSENVASKLNLRSFGLHGDYSNSLTLSNVGEPSRS